MEPNRIMPDMELKVEVKDLPGKQVALSIRLNGGRQRNRLSGNLDALAPIRQE